MEYGIFSDEGVVADGFYTRKEACEFAAGHFSEEDWETIEEVCHDHPGNAARNCEVCNCEEE